MTALDIRDYGQEPHPSTLIPVPDMEEALRTAFQVLDEHRDAMFAREAKPSSSGDTRQDHNDDVMEA